MAIITNLRKWLNGEIFNARDYVYERDVISRALNDNTARIESLQDFEDNLTTNFLNKTTTELQNVAGIVNFDKSIKLDGSLVDWPGTLQDIEDLKNAPRKGNLTFLEEEEPVEELREGDLWFNT